MSDENKRLSNSILPFKKWVNESSSVEKNLLPLTHITLGRFARDIILEGKIDPRPCKVMKQDLAYFFYGRACYRVGGNETVSAESRLPICLVLNGKLIEKAEDVFPFDTGAFSDSLYKDYLGKEFETRDFSLSGDKDLPNKLIDTAYPSVEHYLNGNTEKVVDPDDVSNRGDFEVQGYLKLINTKGSNSPDDRLGSIEVVFSDPVSLENNLLCAIVPHTLFDPKLGAPWIYELESNGVKILTYEFLPKRRPEYFQAEIEKLFREFCREKGLLEEG